MLTYNGTDCEPDTFLAFVEITASSSLVSGWTMQACMPSCPGCDIHTHFVAVEQDQCVSATFSDVPDVVEYLYPYVDSQIWQCSDDDGIGYDLSNQPTMTQYDKNCKKGLRAIGYYRKQTCLATDEGESFSVTCNKKSECCLRLQIGLVNEFGNVSHPLCC
jgi:hypothetical protein